MPKQFSEKTSQLETQASEGNINIEHFAIGLILSTGLFVVYSLFFVAAFWNVFVPIVIFNFLFALTTFLLDGSLWLKILLLAIGNAVGLAWSVAWNSFTVLATTLFGSPFEAFHAIFCPFFHSIWIISFWSIGISALASHKIRMEKTP